MNIRRLALVSIALLPLSQALAASVVMVQFGSFETKEEAAKRLSDVKSSNAAALGATPTSVREVKLPPDNLTVYRTQAGPLESRAAAQSLCGKLAVNGSECYVVETAVSVPSASAPVVAAAAPVVSETAKAVNDTAKSVTDTAKSVTDGAKDVANTKLSDVVNVAKPSVEMTTPAVASPELQAAMNRAVSAQESGLGDVATAAPVAPAAAPAPTKSFWSRLNPFSGDTAKPAAAPVAVTEKLPTAAPVAPIIAAALPPAPAILETPKLAKETKMELPAPPVVVAAPVVTAPAPIVISTPKVIAAEDSRPRLLPPPAPLTAQDKKLLETERTLVKPLPEVLAAPIAAPNSMTPPKPLMPIAKADGTVKVEEAKRVPLSEITVASPAAPVVVSVPSVPAPTAALLPSSTLGQRTLWAQIGQFNNSEEALAFWDKYRQSHPDFPVVRVRVASSLQQQQHGNDRVWLRVGPFARDGFIRALCDEVDDKRCGTVTDLGIAANANGTLSGYLNGSRYKR